MNSCNGFGLHVTFHIRKIDHTFAPFLSVSGGFVSLEGSNRDKNRKKVSHYIAMYESHHIPA